MCARVGRRGRGLGRGVRCKFGGFLGVGRGKGRGKGEARGRGDRVELGCGKDVG